MKTKKSFIIDISTLAGIKKAERYQANGYKLYNSGYCITQIGFNKLKFEIPNK